MEDVGMVGLKLYADKRRVVPHGAFDKEEAVICKCKDWKPNIDIVNGFIVMQANMAWGNKKGYTGKAFRFCPWCGKKLVAERKGKK